MRQSSPIAKTYVSDGQRNVTTRLLASNEIRRHTLLSPMSQFLHAPTHLQWSICVYWTYAEFQQPISRAYAEFQQPISRKEAPVPPSILSPCHHSSIHLQILLPPSSCDPTIVATPLSPQWHNYHVTSRLADILSCNGSKAVMGTFISPTISPFPLSASLAAGVSGPQDI